MVSDNTTTGDGEKCAAKKANGERCENPATEGNYCWIESHGEGADEGADEGVGEIPSESAFRELGGFIMELTDFTPKKEDPVPTQAAKAFLDAKDAGIEGYTAMFGQCEAEGCEYGANGFNAAHCRRHEGSDEGSDEGVSLDDLDEAAKKGLVNEVLEMMKEAQ